MVVATAAFMLVAALFIYNASQINTTRMQLQTTADAAAYSGGLMMARSYNYAAYNNRAMVANQVAVAQLVGLSSWSRYYCLLYTATACGDQIGSPIPSGAIIESQLIIASGTGEPGNTLLRLYRGISATLFTSLETAIPLAITALDTVITASSLGSKAYLTGVTAELALGGANLGVLANVVHANDPLADISTFGMASVAGTVATGATFVSTRQPVLTKPLALGAIPDGTRFRDVVEANLDSFSSFRFSTETLPFPLVAIGSCPGAIGIGLYGAIYSGSTLLSPDNTTWSAVDAGATLGVGACGAVVYEPEPPPGAIVGFVIIYPLLPTVAAAAAAVGGVLPPDPLIDINAMYSGLQNYVDVSNTFAESKESPTLTLYVKRDQTSIDTTEQLLAKGLAPTDNLTLEDGEQGGILQVGASAHAYFAPPEDGATLGGQEVYGSLFSPYWEARLVNTGLITPFSTVAATLLQ